MPCHLWATKCVSLLNDSRVVVAEGIFHSVSSNFVIEMAGFSWGDACCYSNIKDS